MLVAPRTLSPTKVSAFTNCPLAFRYVNIDGLPEEPSEAAMKGTLVHTVLERLFWEYPPGERTPGAAADILASEDSDLKGDAVALIENYFTLEDPNTVTEIGVELRVEADIGGVRLRGVIDRLDLRPDGELVVIDYKTGRAPSQGFEHGRLVGVQLYALLCESILGRAPAEVRLLHLREPVVIAQAVQPQMLRAQLKRAEAIWAAIQRACDAEDFRPKRSALCRFCSFQDHCPEFGGEILPAP